MCAGELVEQGSDLTGGTWTTNAQYLRAGGGCSSMLIRRKSSTDDEYHHEDVLGVFGVITGASGAVLSSNVYDAFDVLQSTNGSAQSPDRLATGFLDYDGLITFDGTFTYAPRSLDSLSFGSGTGGNNGPFNWKCYASACYRDCILVGHNQRTCFHRCCEKKKKKTGGGSGGKGGTGGGTGGSNSGESGGNDNCPSGLCPAVCDGDHTCLKPGQQFKCGNITATTPDCSAKKKTARPIGPIVRV